MEQAMTDAATAALAAALATTEVGCWATGARHSASQDDDQHERDAEAIIAALAAAGWYLAQPETTEALEAAAVRAELEGLRADIDARIRPNEWPDGMADRINAAINARLGR